MIEQTELIVTKWQYHPPVNPIEEEPGKLFSFISLDVMKKRATTKKGSPAALLFALYLKMIRYWNTQEKILM